MEVAALMGDADAAAIVERVSAAVGSNPTPMARQAMWENLTGTTRPLTSPSGVTPDIKRRPRQEPLQHGSETFSLPPAGPPVLTAAGDQSSLPSASVSQPSLPEEPAGTTDLQQFKKKGLTELVDDKNFTGRVILEFQNAQLVTGPFYTFDGGGIESGKQVLESLLQVAKQVRGQTWRCTRVTFTGPMNQSTMQWLSAGAGGLNHMIAGDSDLAYVVYMMPQPAMTKCYLPMPGGSTDVKVEHMSFKSGGNVRTHVMGVIHAMVSSFSLVGGTMCVKELESCANDPEGILTYDEAIMHVRDMDLEQWRRTRAEARRLRVIKSETPLSRAVMVMGTELDSFVTERAKADAIVLRVAPAPTDVPIANYPADISKDMLECVGWSWDSVFRRIVKHSWDDYVNTELHLLKSAILVGPGGGGKSNLMRQMARRFGLMYDKRVFVFTKQLDPLGVLTKSGTLLDVAAVCATDFDPVSQNGVELTSEGLKGLLDCEEGGGYACRYHQAVIKGGIPRLFAVNGDDKTAIDAWFTKFPVTSPLASLVRKDDAALRVMQPDYQAICRRVIIFPTPRVILEANGVSILKESAKTKLLEGQERLKNALPATEPSSSSTAA